MNEDLFVEVVMRIVSGWKVAGSIPVSFQESEDPSEP